MSNFKIIKSDYKSTSHKHTAECFINGNTTPHISDFYTQIAKDLHFPDYFGKNLDALNDCLNDLSWLEQNQVHIVLTHYDKFLSSEPKDVRWNVLHILDESAKTWKDSTGTNKMKFDISVEHSDLFKQDLIDAGI